MGALETFGLKTKLASATSALRSAKAGSIADLAMVEIGAFARGFGDTVGQKKLNQPVGLGVGLIAGTYGAMSDNKIAKMFSAGALAENFRQLGALAGDSLISKMAW